MAQGGLIRIGREVRAGKWRWSSRHRAEMKKDSMLIVYEDDQRGRPTRESVCVKVYG